MNELSIAIEICRENIVKPQYIHPGDAGMDVCAAIDLDIAPEETKIVPLGFKVAIPEGYEIQIRPRSGLSLKTRLRMPNSIGTIDAGYRGELGVIIHNSSPKNPAGEELKLNLAEKENRAGIYQIKAGERIAQLVVAPVMHAVWHEVDDVTAYGENRGGGYGHSGV